jgi:murein DD-endopeptidase MepM/ murein hydrolase activator NlpD
VLAATVLVLAAGAPVAGAAPATPPATSDLRQQQIKGEIKSLRSQVAEASADEDDLLGQIDASDARVEELSAKVAGLDAQITALSAGVTEAQATLNAAETRLLEAGRRLHSAERALEDAQDEMRARAVAAYTQGPVLEGAADLVLRTSNPRELVARTQYLRVVVDEQRRAVERVRTLRDQMAGLKGSVTTARKAAFEHRNDVRRQQDELRAVRDSHDDVRQQVIAQQTARAQLLEQIRARKAEFEQQLTALQQESATITVLLQTRQAGVAVQAAGRGVLAYPIPGARITSTFGARVHPIFGDVRMHTGLDFGAAMGTPIEAAADGVVVYAGPRGGYGNATIVDHGGAVATMYAHQSVLLVQEGQQVVKGQVIGRVGSTGFSTGPHLHFEVRVAGTPVDPLTYL